MNARWLTGYVVLGVIIAFCAFLWASGHADVLLRSLVGLVLIPTIIGCLVVIGSSFLRGKH